MIRQSSMLISGLLELAVFMYYANSVFMPKRSYTKSNFFVILGYIILFMLSLLYIPAVNIGAFVIINFALIYLCFDTTLKTAVIQTCILTAIMMLSEGILSMLTNIGIYQNSLADISLSARIVHAVFSKLLYFVGILIDKYISKSRHEKYDPSDGNLSMIIIPVFTILSIMGIMSVFEYINEKQRFFFAFISVLGVITNIIAFWIYDRTLVYHKEIQNWQEQKYKDNLDLAYYNMLEEKLAQAKIMRHDFKEHLEVLKQYIKDDNNRAAEYLKSVENRNDEINIVNYTNNRVLNILFSEKYKICVDKGIGFKIHASDINMDFMKDIDIVSIMSNLLNNAIESCEKSAKKFIYINLYKMNNAFLVIKTENSCDEKPHENNGFYQSTKFFDKEHGIGLKSVSEALKKYNGDLRLEYDNKEKMFSAVIMIPLIK